MISDSIKQTIAKVEEFDFISLDIFDTLITRLCHFPADIFSNVEAAVPELLHGQDFISRRIRAEERARRFAASEGKQEITLDQIYFQLAKDVIAQASELEQIKQTEIRLEIQFAVPTPLGMQLLSALKDAKKRFVLTSDMYLPRKAIEEILQKCAIDGFEVLFLSNEIGRTKHHGALYGDVVEHFGAKPICILQVGDNQHADFTQALKAGLSAHHVPAAREVFALSQVWRDSALFVGSSSFKTVFNAAYVNQLAASRPIHKRDVVREEEYWSAFGALVVAPLILSLALWIYETCKHHKIEKVAFLARDGQFAMRVFDLLFAEDKISTTYIAASRRMLTAPNKILSPTELKNFYGALATPGNTAEDLLHKIAGGPALSARLTENGINLSEPLNKKSIARLFTVLGENSGALTSALKDECDNVRAYLRSELPAGRRSAVFDLGWRGSLQASIEKTLRGESNIIGLYFGTSNEALDILGEPGLKHYSYTMHNGLPEDQRNACQLHTDVIEFIFSANHGSVETVISDGMSFVWKEAPISEQEQKTQDIAKIFQRSAIDSIEQILQRFEPKDFLQMHCKNASASDFFKFLQSPTAFDAHCFREVMVFSAIGDTQGEYLIRRRETESLTKAYQRSRWAAGYWAGLGRFQKRRVKLTMKLKNRFRRFRKKAQRALSK